DQTKDHLIKTLIKHFDKIKIPKYCFLVQGDNELLLNTNNSLCIEIILEQLLKSNEIILTERIEGDDKIVKDTNGLNYSHEAIFSFTKNKLIINKNKSKIDRKLSNSLDLDRHVLPGDNWLYFKIYTGYNYAEHILSKLLFPIIEKHKELKTFDKFFFIRYNDPDYHLRIRVYKYNNPNFWTFIRDINEGIRPYVKDNIIYKIQFDTYQREIERYGASNMEYTETLFSYNSYSILKYLKLNKKLNTGNNRWLTALFVIDTILSDFRLDLEMKREFTQNQRDGFFKNFNFNSNQKKSISNKFFQERNIILKSLEDEAFCNPLKECFVIKEIEYLNTVNNILSNTTKENNQLLFGWLGSYIHMFINRLFQSNPVQHEMIIYDYLYRYFDSKLAREINFKKENTTD
ncbi:MAG: thiopeptide-type bacteriocin biosynthesis protein, partial [Candidatus Paceibacterota bacterium]